MGRGNRLYLNYYHSNPDKFEDEPPLGACGTIFLRQIECGESTDRYITQSAGYRKERWEAYHRAKAKTLGLEIDIDLLARSFPLRGSNFDILE